MLENPQKYQHHFVCRNYAIVITKNNQNWKIKITKFGSHDYVALCYVFLDNSIQLHQPQFLQF